MFAHLDQTTHGLKAIEEIDDDNSRNAVVLGNVKALVELTKPLFVQARQTGYDEHVAALRRHFKIDAARQAPASDGHLSKSDGQRLKYLLNVYERFVTDMLSEIADEDVQKKFVLAAFKTLLPPTPEERFGSEFTLSQGTVDIIMSEQITDPEVRNIAIVVLIRILLYHAACEFD